MWLVYLRFDDQGSVKTYHIRVPDQRSVKDLMACAEQRGLSSTARLEEYAIFSSGRTIQARTQPNFHFYLYEDWMERWKAISS